MLRNLTCVIVDDEPKAINILQERLQLLFPNITVLNTFSEWKNALETLRAGNIDLLFLDVSMPEKTGVDILKLFPSIPFQVIFITAHSEYALDAIKFSAAGYVLKPIDDVELSFAVNKAIERIKGTTGNIAQASAASNPLKIGIPNQKGIDYLNISEILYFESVNKYTKVVTRDYSILSSYNLAEFKKIVDEKFFFQAHRSYIINLYHIKRYETSGVLVMEDNMQIPVSRSVRSDFQQVFGKITKTAGIK